MPADLRQVRELQAHYQESQRRLIVRLSEQLERGNQTDFTERMLSTVNAEMRELDNYAEQWVKGTLPAQYRNGVEGVYKYLGQTVQATRNQNALNIVMQNALADLHDAHQYVGRVVQDEIRQSGLDAVAGKLTVGDTVKATADNLKRNLADRGIKAVQTKRGEMSLDAYATMVARSTTREATNLGTIQAMKETGNDLVQMSNHNASCPICAPLEGRVYSISGRDPNYPRLDFAFGEGYANVHPNCRHVLTPYIERFDRNLEKTREFSNRPFDIDPRPEAQRKRYEVEQAAKRLLRNDMMQWQRYKLTLGDDVPKTLTTFRRWKKQNGEKWTSLQGKYRSERRKEI